MDSSSGFGSTPCDWTLISNSLSLRLPYSVKLATECKSLTHYAKGTQSPLVRLLLFVCMRFQVLFHSPPGVLPTFPSRYWYTIGLRQSSALRDGPRGFGQDSTCPALLRCRHPHPHVTRTGVSPSAPTLSRHAPVCADADIAGPTTPPRPRTRRFRLLPLRSPLLRESTVSFFSSGY